MSRSAARSDSLLGKRLGQSLRLFAGRRGPAIRADRVVRRRPPYEHRTRATASGCFNTLLRIAPCIEGRGQRERGALGLVLRRRRAPRGTHRLQPALRAASERWTSHRARAQRRCTSPSRVTATQSGRVLSQRPAAATVIDHDRVAPAARAMAGCDRDGRIDERCRGKAPEGRPPAAGPAGAAAEHDAGAARVVALEQGERVDRVGHANRPPPRRPQCRALQRPRSRIRGAP